MKLGDIGLLSRGGFGLADQILSSGTNFATALIVARLLGPADYGSYVIAFGAWIIIMGLMRSTVINPFIIKASALDKVAWMKATSATAGIALGAGFSGGIITAVVGLSFGLTHPIGQPLLVLSFFIPPLTLQDFWRFAAFSIAKPQMALLNDAVWTITQAVAFLMIWFFINIKAAWMIAGWGTGAVAGALFGLWQFQTVPALGRHSFLAWLRENASLSGWLGLENLIYSAGSQITSVLIATIVGRAALGGIQSITNLFSPANIFSQASQTIGLPLASKAMAEGGPMAVRRTVFRYSLFLGLCLTAYAVLMLGAGPTLLNKIFGEAFTEFSSLILPLTLGFLLNFWSNGAFIGLLSTGAGSRLVLIQLCVFVTQILTVSALGLKFGILGVAWALPAIAAVRFFGLWLMCLKATRPLAFLGVGAIRLN